METGRFWSRLMWSFPSKLTRFRCRYPVHANTHTRTCTKQSFTSSPSRVETAGLRKRCEWTRWEKKQLKRTETVLNKQWAPMTHGKYYSALAYTCLHLWPRLRGKRLRNKKGNVKLLPRQTPPPLWPTASPWNPNFSEECHLCSVSLSHPPCNYGNFRPLYPSRLT